MHIHRIDVDFEHASTNMHIIPIDKRSDHSNYYGSTSDATGILEVPHYGGVRYANVYPGVDVTFHFTENGMVEYDIKVEHLSELEKVRFRFKGSDDIQVSNDLVQVGLTLGSIEEHMPASWYTVGSTNIPIKAKYVAFDDGTVGFKVSNAPNGLNAPVTIDPTPSLIWGTYYAWGGGEYCRSTFARSSEVYFAGYTASTSTMFATAGAYQTSLAGGIDTDAFLAKFTTGGARTWCTYYGAAPGDGGLGNDDFREITCDASGNIFAVGSSITPPSSLASSGAFQTTMAGGIDAMVVKFSAAGARLWATFFGGESSDAAKSVVLGPGGSVIIAGTTSSTTGIATSGVQQTSLGGGSDAFLASFNSTGTALQWATYYGGSSDESNSFVRITSTNQIMLGGSTHSTTGIATNGSYQSTIAGGMDVYMAQFSTTGMRAWGTYYGGTGTDRLEDLAMDCHGAFFFGGYTTSTGLGTSGVHQQNLSGFNADGFLTKFSSLGTRVWTTYYGGTASDVIYSISRPGPGLIYVAGTAASTEGIATPGSQQPALIGASSNGFLALLNDNGVRTWGTYYGGIYATVINDIYATNVVYATGTTNSPSNIATTGAYQTSLPNTTAVYNGFLAKFSGAMVPSCTIKSLDIPSEEAQLPRYVIIPNPTSGAFATVTPGLPANLLVHVFAADGRVVRTTRTTDTSRLDLDLTTEPAGLYTVRIAAPGGDTLMRVMKE